MGVHRLLAALALLASLSMPVSAHILVPVSRIGPGWSGDHYSWTSFVAFSRDGREVASDGPADPNDVSGALTLWRFPDGRLITRAQGRPSALSPDFEYYATDKEVRSLRDDKAVYTPTNARFAGFAFSPDSRYVAVSNSKKNAQAGAIRIVSLPDGKTVLTFGSALPASVAVSPDGKLLAAGYWDIVVLWNVHTGERIATLRKLGRYVDSLSFDRRSRLLAAGTDLGTVQVWDVRHRRRIQKFSVDGQFVSTPAFHPDGRYLAFGTYGTGTVFLGDLHTGKIVDQRKISDLGCGSVAFSPDGRYLITPSTGGLVTWPYDVGGTIRVFRVGAH